MTDNTSNHNLQQPTKGTEDWHVPLNENFAKIDTGVEIRDEEGNRREYEPKQGSKFFATDTGVVYVGDGDAWRKLGSLVKTTESTRDGTIVATPGDVQSAIDEASTESAFARAPTQTVKLVSGKTYKINDTIAIRQNVRLECNGAKIVPTGDFNIFELYRGSQLISPFCDTRDVDWGASQVVVGAKDAGKVDASNRAWVKDAYLMGKPGRGIGLQFRGGDQACSMQYASGTINGFDRAIDFYATGEDTDEKGFWSNGNQFFGRIRNYRIGVSMRSEGAAVSGNSVQLQAQPSRRVSEWLWKMEEDPRDKRNGNKYIMQGNVLIAHPWDNQNYKNSNQYYQSDDRRAPIWFIGRGERYGNSIWDTGGTLSNEYIVNNSDTPTRNGIFTSHGGWVTGTGRFRSQPVYEPNAGVRWHDGSTNG